MIKEFEWIKGGSGHYYLMGDGTKPYKGNPYILFDMTRKDLWSLLKATIKVLFSR